MNAHEFFQFTTLESIYWYGNTSRAMYLHDIYVMDQLAEKETFFINLSKLIELNFIPTT